MITVVLLVTAYVVIGKVMEVLVAGTVTVACTAANTLSLVSFTTTPAGPAGPLSVTVPWIVKPPTSVAGSRSSRNSETSGAFTSSDVSRQTRAPAASAAQTRKALVPVAAGVP